MLVHSCAQGSGEWLRLRAGIPTASQFHRIITPGGKPSKSAEMYMFELLAERITGNPTVEAVSYWMDRGSQMEAEAVSFYELQRDCETVKMGFVSNDAGTIGASPDRMVGDDGLLEIKVCKPAIHVGLLLKSGSAYNEHKIQTQGQLWVAEREWDDLLAYHPEMPPGLIRVERDEKFIATLSKAVSEFSDALESMALELIERGWITKPQSIISPWDDLEVGEEDVPQSSAPVGTEAGSRSSPPQTPPAVSLHVQPGDGFHLQPPDGPESLQNEAERATPGEKRTVTPPVAWIAQMLALADKNPAAFKKKMDSLGYRSVNAIPVEYRLGALEAMRLAVR